MRATGAPPLPISLCMIVKNEARLIAQCLESARGLVSQMVVVDTGSTDETTSLAEAAGAEVYHHPWEGHFSIARNQSLSYARQPWVLILDGDELLPPDAEASIRALNLGAQAPEAYNFTIVNFTTDRADEREASLQTQMRLFQRKAEHGYAGLIHNQLVHLTEGRPLASAPSEVRVLHYGYTPAVWAHQRKDERLSMLRAAAESEPENRFHHYNLGNHLKILKRYPEALAAFLRALPEEAPLHAEWMPIACCSAAFCAQSAGQPELAISLAELALSQEPQLVDAHQRAAEAELGLQRYGQVIERLTSLLQHPERRAIKLTSLYFYVPYRLGRALWLSGRPLEALPLFLSLIPRTQDVTVFTHATLCAWHSGAPALAERLLALGRALAPADPDWAPVSELLARGAAHMRPFEVPQRLFELPLYARVSQVHERADDLWEKLYGHSHQEAFERLLVSWSPSYAQRALEGDAPLERLPRLQPLRAGDELPLGLAWLLELNATSAQLTLRADREVAWSSPASIPVAMEETAEERVWGPAVLYALMRQVMVELS